MEVERRQPLREAAKLSCPIRWGLGPSKEIYIGHCSVPPMLCPFRKKYGPGLLFQFNKQAMIEIENYEVLNNQLPSIDYFIDSSSIYCVTMTDSPWKLRNLFALSLVSSLLGCWQLGEFTNWSIMVNLTHVQPPRNLTTHVPNARIHATIWRFLWSQISSFVRLVRLGVSFTISWISPSFHGFHLNRIQ